MEPEKMVKVVVMTGQGGGEKKGRDDGRWGG